MSPRLRRSAAVLAPAVSAAALLAGQSLAHDASPAQPGTQATFSSDSAPTGGVVVSRAAERDPAAGNPDYFTGRVTVTPLFEPNAHSTAGAGKVEFRRGARTAWHTHPAGQRLIITDGTGWVQEWGRKRITVKEGDVVWFAPGVKHWHGATATESMTHIAVQDTVNGSNVDWMEHVTDQQYRSGRS